MARASRPSAAFSNDSTGVMPLPAMAGGSPRHGSLQVAASMLDLVGSTPLVELARISPKPEVTIYAKLEGQNPGGSVKDADVIAAAIVASGIGAP